LHLRAGNALKDIPAHHGVDLEKVTAAERATDEPASEGGGWSVPVLATNALTDEGVAELLETVQEHGTWLESSGQLSDRRRERATGRIMDVVDRELRRVAWKSGAVRELLAAGAERVQAGDATPYSAAREILDTLLR
jgi:LAO/AO transport system kinase